jgi:preprotein translocase subunit SecE
MFKRIKKFLIEVKEELSKVSWSTKEELIGATWVVILVTSLLAIFIGIVDFILSKFLILIVG